MSSEITLFDPAEYLTDDESIGAYLTEALEGDDAHGITQALGDVVRARGGVDRLAGQTGIDAEMLRQALDSAEAPSLDLLLRIMHALGVRLSAKMVA